MKLPFEKEQHRDDFTFGFSAGKKAYKGNPEVHKAHAESQYEDVQSVHGTWWIDGFCAAIDLSRGVDKTKPARIAKQIGLEDSKPA